jgi:hypothetical protein
MATAKKAAKKAVPKVVEEVKQIVLTQEQYDELKDIKFNVMLASVNLAEAFSDEEQNVRQVAFEIGKIQAKLDIEEAKLDKIIDDIDPNPYDPWQEFEENVDENDN